MTAVSLSLLLAVLSPAPAQVPDTVWKDCTGKEHRPADWKDASAVVLLFLNTECPVANFYAPEFEQLARAARERGVVVLGVYPDPDVDAAAGQAHGKEYGLTFPRLLDPEQKLARGLGVRVTPEAAVLSSKGKLLYLGRFDDRFGPDGKRRTEPTTRDLQAALDAVLAGKPVAAPWPKAFGCPLPRPQNP